MTPKYDVAEFKTTKGKIVQSYWNRKNWGRTQLQDDSDPHWIIAWESMAEKMDKWVKPDDVIEVTGSLSFDKVVCKADVITLRTESTITVNDIIVYDGADIVDSNDEQPVKDKTPWDDIPADPMRVLHTIAEFGKECPLETIMETLKDMDEMVIDMSLNILQQKGMIFEPKPQYFTAVQDGEEVLKRATEQEIDEHYEETNAEKQVNQGMQASIKKEAVTSGEAEIKHDYKDKKEEPKPVSTPKKKSFTCNQCNPIRTYKTQKGLDAHLIGKHPSKQETQPPGQNKNEKKEEKATMGGPSKSSKVTVTSTKPKKETDDKVIIPEPVTEDEIPEDIRKVLEAKPTKPTSLVLGKSETDSSFFENIPEIILDFSTVRKYLNKYANDQEIAMFLVLCKEQRLNPFKKEVYLIKWSPTSECTMVVAYDVFLKRADTQPDYMGLEAGVIVKTGDEIQEREGKAVFPGEELLGSWCRVTRKGKTPFYVTATLKEFVGTKKDGTPNKFWKKMPGTMIEKVAISQCLRRAYPNVFYQLYSEPEMKAFEEQ